MAIAQHLSQTNEHYTPPHVIALAREVMGGIDLDPASSEEANKIVQAGLWIGLPQDGLAHEWWGNRVFLNPPGGRTPPQWRKEFQTGSNACAWWRKLTREYFRGGVKEAIFVGFTLELLRSAQAGSFPWHHPFDFPICVPSERLRFGGDSPTHANVIVYVGANQDRFERFFESIGRVKR